MRPRFDAKRGDKQKNKLTGELEQMPHEPDANLFKTGDSPKPISGTKFGFIESWLPHVNERVILGVFNVPAGKGHSEADEALKVIDRAKRRLPAAQAVPYDMAMRGKHIDYLYQRGLQPIVKTAKAPGGKLRQRFIEKHDAMLVDGTTEQVEVWGINGGASIRVVAGGEEHLVQCDRNRTYNRVNASGTWRWYEDLTVPDDPRVPPRLRRSRLLQLRIDTTRWRATCGVNRDERRFR